MRRLLLLLMMAAPAAFGYSSYSGFCEQGGVKVTVQGISSPLTFQQSFPNLSQSATGPEVTVYLTGTTTKATIYSDNAGTPKANPFPCSATAQYIFYTADGWYDLLFSGSGISSFTRANIQISNSINVKSCGAKGDGTTNDTAGIQACLDQAVAAGKALYVPGGTYRISAISESASALPITIYGDGGKMSLFTRHASFLSASSNMFTLTTTGAVSLHDFGVDMLNTSGSPFAGADIDISGATEVNADNLYIAHGQVVGLQCQPCSNVTISNSTLYQNWWFGISVASDSTTASPVYLHNFSFTGNAFIDQPIGLGINFFLSDIAVTGNTFLRSTLQFVQTPAVHATVSGNTFDGQPTYGCIGVSGCGAISSYSAIWMEGGSDINITANKISNIAGMQAGIGCTGSKLQIPASTGTILQLPCQRTIASANNLYAIAGNAAPGAIFLGGGSTNGTAGSLNSMIGNHITNSDYCAVMAGTGFDVSGNYCDTIAVNGITLNGATQGAAHDNHLHKISQASSGTYYGFINDTGSSNNLIFDNEVVNESGTTMAACFEDLRLAGSTASTIRHWGNQCANATIVWTPAPAIPTLGTWTLGSLVENFPIATGEATGWVNVSAGSPGNWKPEGTLSGLTADKINQVFGINTPIYAEPLCAVIGINLYSADCSTWKFGAGSSSQYGGILAFDYTSGRWRLYESNAPGNADATATLRGDAMNVYLSAGDPGCTSNNNVGAVWVNTSTTTYTVSRCIDSSGTFGWH